MLVSYWPLGRAESRARYIHFDTVWDNLHSVHKYLERSSDPLFIPWSRARRGRRGRWGADYTLSFLDNNDFGTPGYNLRKHAPILNAYLRKVHAAGGIAAYEKAHLASLAKIFIPKFDGLPKEVVRVIVSFWAHAGYY